MNSYPKVYLYRQIVQAKLFMDSHFARSIGLDNIAYEAFFSKFHFIRLFKSIYGKTPHQYLIGVRIEHARLLLKAGIPVSDACYEVGFSSLSTFSSLFKRRVGSSPSAYQQQQLLRSQEIAKVPLKFVPGCFAEKKGWVRNEQF